MTSHWIRVGNVFAALQGPDVAASLVNAKTLTLSIPNGTDTHVLGFDLDGYADLADDARKKGCKF